MIFEILTSCLGITKSICSSRVTFRTRSCRIHRACIFFIRQKTPYDRRISDWSSDVCSSDLLEVPGRSTHARADVVDRFDAAHGMGNDVRIAEVANDHLDIVAMASRRWRAPDQDPDGRPAGPERLQQGASEEPVRAGAQYGQIGRASWRERVWQYV